MLNSWYSANVRANLNSISNPLETITISKKSIFARIHTMRKTICNHKLFFLIQLRLAAIKYQFLYSTDGIVVRFRQQTSTIEC